MSMRRRMTFILAAALGAMALLAAACGDGERVRVFAASSLTDVLRLLTCGPADVLGNRPIPNSGRQHQHSNLL